MRIMLGVIASVLMIAVGPVGAAERAWFLADNSLTLVSITNQGRDWTESGRIALPTHRSSQPIAVAGGRYIVWGAWTTQGSALVRFDTRSGVVTLFPGIVPRDHVRLAVDRRSGMLVALDWTALYLLDVPNLRVLSGMVLAAPDIEDRALAVAGGRAFVGTNSPGNVNTIVVDLDTLTTVDTFAGVWFAQASRDETRIYLQHRYIRGLELIVDTEVRDTQTLDLIATPTVMNLVDIVGEFVMTKASSGMGPVLVRVHHPDSLDTVFQTTVAIPYPPSELFELQEPSPGAPIVLRTQTCKYGVCGRALQVFDRETLTCVRDFWQAPFDTLRSRMLMLAPPEPPRALRATVAARSVSLEWSAPPDVGDYELAVGTAPGGRDLGAVRIGVRAGVHLDGVPSGTYYVSVRAVNELGSAESNEIQVVVP